MEAAKIAAQTIIEGFANGDLSEKFLSRYQTRCKKKFANYFSSSKIYSSLIYKWPTILDAGL